MNKLRERIRNRLYDRSLPIELRIGFVFVTLSLVSALAGFIICVMVGAKFFSLATVIGLFLVSIVLSLSFYRRGKEEEVYLVLSVLLTVALPIIFLGAGGTFSGVNIWFIFQAFFLTLCVSRRKTWGLLVIAFVIDFGCYLLHYYGASVVYELDSRKNVFVSTISSLVVVAFTLCVTVGLFKRVYAAENKALEETTEELHKANTYQKQFLSNMSHEMRSPLNAVLGLNEMILRSDDINEIKKYAQQIQDSGDALLRQINDILDFNRIESGNMAIMEMEYEVDTLLRSSFQMFSVKMSQKNLNYRIVVEPGVPRKLMGDEVRIKQILTNLLSNACKYTDHGEVVLTVKAKETEEGVTLWMAVKDTGRGISPENQEKLFVVFSRLDLARNRNIEGTGLGLCITKNLVELMGGSIQVNSVENVGSEFCVEIPQKRTNDFRVIENFQIEVETKPKKYRELFRAPDARVLIVDDTPLNLRVVARLLKDTKVQIDTALSGADCLKKVMQKEYDLILMDKMMPQMDGISCFLELQSRGVKAPVVMLTADATYETKAECEKLGFSDFLTKPVNPKDLEITLKKYLPQDKIEVET